MRTSQVQRERIYTHAAIDDLNWLLRVLEKTARQLDRSHDRSERVKIYDDFYQKLYRCGFYKVKPKPVGKNNAK